MLSESMTGWPRNAHFLEIGGGIVAATGAGQCSRLRLQPTAPDRGEAYRRTICPEQLSELLGKLHGTEVGVPHQHPRIAMA